MRRVLFVAIIPVIIASLPRYPQGGQCTDVPAQTDVVVIGATAGGVIGAVSAARAGARVLLLELGNHLGGMVASGLGATDGTPSGGISAEFFERVGGMRFAPSAAASVFEEMVRNEKSLRVVRRCGVAGVEFETGTTSIGALMLDSGARVRADVYIDATYEGDLLALANVTYTVGREANFTYGESLGGVLPSPPIWACGCNWNLGAVNGTDASGTLLPMVQSTHPGDPGSKDQKVQAYGFRLCLTQDTENKRPLPIPAAYDPSEWELLRRSLHNRSVASSLKFSSFFRTSEVAANKTDVNNAGGLATDFISGSWRWPDASRAERAAIYDAHVNYTLGLFHFLRSDAAVPPPLRAEVASWGLAADEFTDSDGFPHQLYVREARRMIGDWVFTQDDRTLNQSKTDSIAVGHYNLDAHMAQRTLAPDGTVTNEGCLSGGAAYKHLNMGEFELPYRLMLPRRSEAGNLLVCAAVSASHVGSASIRLEPQYMNLGEAAGVAASMVVAAHAKGNAGVDALTVQDVNITQLQSLLSRQGVRYKRNSGPTPVPTAPAPSSFECMAERCLPKVGGGSGVGCNHTCAALGPREWLALKQHFAAPGGATLRCVHDTWIKKSEANSRSLLPEEKLQVAQGGTLLLTKPPTVVDDHYLLLQCESSACMLH